MLVQHYKISGLGCILLRNWSIIRRKLTSYPCFSRHGVHSNQTQSSIKINSVSHYPVLENVAAAHNEEVEQLQPGELTA